MNVTQQLQSSLYKELIQKDAEIKEAHSKLTSQQQDRAIPNNVFFEWVGNKNIVERCCHVIHHFNSLAKFNDFSVAVLVDNPYKFMKTESQLEGVTGHINLITVDQLNKDFLTALKESEVPESDKLYRDFIQTTQQHGVGLSNQALRSDYYRLALLFTYGGIHSDAAPILHEFDRSPSSLEYPLIPLKGKNGLLIAVNKIKINIDHPASDAPDKTIVDSPGPNNTIIASDKHNPTILAMLKYMLQMESHLKTCNLNTSEANYGFKKSLYDVMRLPQCKREHTQRMTLEWLLITMRLILDANDIFDEALREACLNSVKAEYDKVKDHQYSVFKEHGTNSARFLAVAKVLAGGTEALPVYCKADKRDKLADFIEQSTFPLSQGKPTFGNLKDRTDLKIGGLRSWHGYSNPKSVDDIGIRM